MLADAENGNDTSTLIIEKVKDAALSIDPDARVYLFGSRARQDHQADSDWDFFVATTRDDRRAFEHELSYPVFDLMLEHGVIIQIITFPKHRWEMEHSPSPLYDNIREEGIEL